MFGHGRILLCRLCGIGAEVLGVRAENGPGPARRLVCCSITQQLLYLLSVANVCDSERPGAPRHGQGGWCDKAASPSSTVAGVKARHSWRTAAVPALSRRLPQRAAPARTQPCLPSGPSAPSFCQRTACVASLNGIVQ